MGRKFCGTSRGPVVVCGELFRGWRIHSNPEMQAEPESGAMMITLAGVESGLFASCLFQSLFMCSTHQGISGGAKCDFDSE